MPAVRQSNVATSYSDPPFEMSGMVRLRTDPDGKLREFEAVPPQVEPAAGAATPFDWAKLFQAAGLDSSKFQAADPQWTPLANWDARAAWTGADPAGGGGADRDLRVPHVAGGPAAAPPGPAVRVNRPTPAPHLRGFTHP
jgi:hypothetical protein